MCAALIPTAILASIDESRPEGSESDQGIGIGITVMCAMYVIGKKVILGGSAALCDIAFTAILTLHSLCSTCRLCVRLGTSCLGCLRGDVSSARAWQGHESYYLFQLAMDDCHWRSVPHREQPLFVWVLWLLRGGRIRCCSRECTRSVFCKRALHLCASPCSHYVIRFLLHQFVYFYLPETANRTSPEIDEEYIHHKPSLPRKKWV